MTGDPRLERYLTSLEHVLRPFPVSDRAEIVTEIKSHVLDALDRDKEAQLDGVLAALGEPEIVANRYLLERGLKPTKPPISPVVKWLVIGFLGTFAMILVFAGFIASRFLPFVHVDEIKDKVSILGGMIEVDGDEGSFRINGTLGKSLGNFSGDLPLAPGQEADLKFKIGKVQLSNADDGIFHWECKGYGTNAPTAALQGARVVFDATGLVGAKCDVSVPQGSKIMVHGVTGKLELIEPHYDARVELDTGKVVIHPDQEHAYRFDLMVKQGKMDAFNSSDKQNVHQIFVRLDRGTIVRED